MPWTNQERNRYQEDYKRENYDIIKVLTPKGTRERLKAEAARQGLTVSMLIYQAIARILPPDEIPGTDPTGTGTGADRQATAATAPAPDEFPADPPEPSKQIPEDAETNPPTDSPEH